MSLISKYKSSLLNWLEEDKSLSFSDGNILNAVDDAKISAFTSNGETVYHIVNK